MDIVVARYNDMSGVSMSKDKEYLKRLPVYLWIFNLMRWRTKEGRRALFLGYVRSFRVRTSQVREAGSRLFGARNT